MCILNALISLCVVLIILAGWHVFKRVRLAFDLLSFVLAISFFSFAGYSVYVYYNFNDKVEIQKDSVEMSAAYSKLGQTGDYFGGLLNPFISLMALIYLMISVKQSKDVVIASQKQIELAREQLELSRQELQATREELEGSRIALESQATLAARQAFESTFFKLLSLYNESISLFSWKMSGVYSHIKGENAFKEAYKEIIAVLKFGQSNEVNVKSYNTSFNNRFAKDDCILIAESFKLLITILDFLYRDMVGRTDERYINIICSLMCRHEMKLFSLYLVEKWDSNEVGDMIKYFGLIEKFDGADFDGFKKLLASKGYYSD